MELGESQNLGYGVKIWGVNPKFKGGNTRGTQKLWGNPKNIGGRVVKTWAFPKIEVTPKFWGDPKIVP